MRRSPGAAIGTRPVERQAGGVREQVANGRAGRAASSSRSTTPSSAATRVASATTGFVIEAQRNSRASSPVPVADAVRVDDADGDVVGRPAVDLQRASTRGDTRRVERRLISSGGKYEPIIGYSRAVVVGGHVYVAARAGDARRRRAARDPYGQARRCFEIISPRSTRRVRAPRTSCARASTSRAPRSSPRSRARTPRSSGRSAP